MEILIFWKYCELAMRIGYAAPGRERVPARGLLRSYLKVERAGRIPAREIAAKLGGEKRASVFCVGAVRAGLLCRLRWGGYAAPPRGASTRSDVLSSADPKVRSPAAVETAKRALAEMARRTLQSGGG